MRAFQNLVNNITNNLRRSVYDVYPLKFQSKKNMAQSLGIAHYHSLRLTPSLPIPKLNPRSYGGYLRSWVPENVGGFNAQMLRCRSHCEATMGSKGIPRAMEGGGYGGAGGSHGGGGDKGGSGDGMNSDDGAGNGKESKSFLSWYMLLLERYPVATKALTSALLTFFGDLFCQLMIEDSSAFDVKRISMFTLLGLVLVGPTLHFWYLSLSKLVSGSGVSKAGLRLLLDQFLFAPIFIGIFFSSLLTLEGRPSEIQSKLRQEWVPSVLANWKLWIPFQFLNFLVVPQPFQVLAANFISLAWNIYLSFASHRKVPSAANS